jgi:hypothetical protein
VRDIIRAFELHDGEQERSGSGAGNDTDA